MIAIVLLATQLLASEVPIGVGAVAQDGGVCVALPESTLAPGTAVTLIRHDPPQSALRATIDRAVPTCERLERALNSGPYYHVQLPPQTGPGSGLLWVVFPGLWSTRTIENGNITLQLSDAHPNAQVRSCTSSEGLHLTVWADTPLMSERLWHQYYYLGYGVEPSCDELDFR